MSHPHQIVIFGASGDLAQRKLLPALAQLARRNQPANGFHIVGVARRPKTDESYRTEIRERLPEAERPAFDELAPRVSYVTGDVAQADDMARLRAHLDALPGGNQAGRLEPTQLGKHQRLTYAGNNAGFLRRGRTGGPRSNRHHRQTGDVIADPILVQKRGQLLSKFSAHRIRHSDQTSWPKGWRVLGPRGPLGRSNTKSLSFH